MVVLRESQSIIREDTGLFVIGYRIGRIPQPHVTRVISASTPSPHTTFASAAAGAHVSPSRTLNLLCEALRAMSSPMCAAVPFRPVSLIEFRYLPPEFIYPFRYKGHLV